MKQQLLQDREVLIQNLQRKIDQLKNQRKNLLQNEPLTSVSTGHVNIQQYLNQQGPSSQPKQTNSRIPPLPKIQDQVQHNAVASQADLIRSQRETKKRLEELKDLYEKKRELQSIGVNAKDLSSIRHMYNDKEMKKKIDRKLCQSKKLREAKEEKDKIIKEELEKVEKFLTETKQKQKKSDIKPEHHYSRLISQQQELNLFQNLINKSSLTLAEKEKLLDQTFQLLKVYGNKVEKEKLKKFLLSNPEFCAKFYISKAEILRDLQVHPTSTEGLLTYEQYYEIIKSIQITNKALFPNMNFKASDKTVKKVATKINIKGKSDEAAHLKEMEKYLKNVYVYFDTKSERIIQRQRFQIALKKGLLFDDKKYKLIKKAQIMLFGQRLMSRREKVPKLEYYKNLEMKYIGLEEILEEYKKNISKQQTQSEQRQEIIEKNDQNLEEMSQTNQKEEEESYIPEPLPNSALEETDFEEYGWGKAEPMEEKFRDLKRIDKYYSEVQNQYGNEIAWNGIERYKEDFTKFNECMKELNKQHN